jgi:hypothetical protein
VTEAILTPKSVTAENDAIELIGDIRELTMTALPFEALPDQVGGRASG